MRAKWNEANGGLSLHTSEGWIYVGWVETNDRCSRVFCCWLDGSGDDYPENKIFETAKQARRALKATATVAIIGGFRGL